MIRSVPLALVAILALAESALASPRFVGGMSPQTMGFQGVEEAALAAPVHGAVTLGTLVGGLASPIEANAPGFTFEGVATTAAFEEVTAVTGCAPLSLDALATALAPAAPQSAIPALVRGAESLKLLFRTGAEIATGKTKLKVKKEKKLTLC